MTIHEKLDLVLNEIKDHYGHHPIEKNWERICRLVTDGNGIDTGNPDWRNDPFLAGLIDGLVSENFIRVFHDRVADKHYMVATVKGLIFEGFVNQKDRLERERAFAQSVSDSERILSERLDRLQTRMVRLTLVIAVGTLVAALYYGIEIWKYYHPSCCH